MDLAVREYWFWKVHTDFWDGLSLRLLIVIAKMSLIGRCVLLSSLEGQRSIRGKKHSLTSILFHKDVCIDGVSPHYTSHVPLHNPLAGLMFIGSIMGKFIFILSVCEGIPLGQ